jgi:two-component system sensor histidine kinase KdpD
MLKSVAGMNFRGMIRRNWPISFLISGAAIAGITLVVYVLRIGDSLANVVMLYLLIVILVAVKLGRAAAVFASVLSFLTIDFFFVEPIYTLTVAEPTEWLALTVFLVVSIITGQLTALLRAEVQNTSQHDREMTILAETSWEVASELNSHTALQLTLRKISNLLDFVAMAVINVVDVDVDGLFVIHTSYGLSDQSADEFIKKNVPALSFVKEKGLPVGPFAPSFPNSATATTAYCEASRPANDLDTLLPIPIEGIVQAVVLLRARTQRTANNRERQILQALINHVVLVLEREKSFAVQAKAQGLLEANKLKAALLAMVSHDFRSPLTAIKATIQTMKSARGFLPEEETISLLDGVDHEVDRLERVVKNILDLSRLEANAWRPKCEMIPVSELLGSALDSFSEKENQRIVLNSTNSGESLWVDSVQLGQVIHNLVENALKYSPPESTVELACRFDNGSAIIEVLDRGIGVPIGEEEHLFEPFHRGTKLSESNIAGVGLGLSICRGLVEAHGGIINASRRAGGGSIFRVTLPNRHATEFTELVKK